MNLRVEEIRYENIREFGNVELDFTRPDSSDTHHISLVQMPNGTGKTTTMGLIRHLILGTDLEEEQVREYEPKFDYEGSGGEFTMALATPSRRFRLHMQLDYDLGTVTYRHSYPQREGGGTNNSHFLPPELEETLTKEFVDLFVFNGELTDKFTATDEDNAETALKIVSRLDRIETQRQRIERIVEKRQDGDGAVTEQGLKTNRTELQKSRKRLEELRTQKKTLKTEIGNHDGKIEELENELEEIIAENQEALTRYKELEKEIKNQEQTLHNEAKDILGEMRRPSKLSDSFKGDFVELLEHMTILKLPKSTSEEFFNELSEGETCICGRTLDEEHRQSIQENADEYLSDEDIGVLNTLKEQLRNSANVVDFDSRFETLTEARTELKQAEMDQDDLDLDDAELEKRKQQITKEIESKKTKRDEKEKSIELLTTDDKGKRDQYDLDWKTNIPAAKRRVNKFEKKVEKATNTVIFSKQAEKLEEIFGEFIDKSLEELKEQQIKRTNERLTQILGLSEVQIESIEDSIQLQGKSGSSEGQSLSVAYAYLSTLFEGSEVDIPFIIDSPAVSLDHKVRREVATIISELFDQLIAFVISTEKEGFVDNLEPQQHDGDADIQYYTIHKTDVSGKVKKYNDRDFFMEFTSEEEEGQVDTPTEAE